MYTDVIIMVCCYNIYIGMPHLLFKGKYWQKKPHDILKNIKNCDNNNNFLIYDIIKKNSRCHKGQSSQE